MTSYDINHKAIAGLRDIYEYGFIHYGEERADKYHADIFLRFDNIAATPLSYPFVEHIGAGYRRSICGVNVIYFRIVDGIVEIMRIIGRQDMTALPD